jgi:replicative DNA helicase
MSNSPSSQINYLSISEAAKFLGVSQDTLRRWDKTGLIKSKRLDGKNRYFSSEDLKRNKTNRPLSISEVSKKLNISPTTLRRLESRGVITPSRNKAVRHDVPVGIFSLEMSSEQLIDRMLAAESFVNSWKLRTGQVREADDFNRIRDALESLSKAPIFIDDKPGNNILAMRAVARRLKRERGIGLIIVDYLQLMSPTSTKSSDSLVQQVTEISRSLKGLARELEVPVIALSQLSRAVEQRGGKPRLSDLRDSGSIEQDADIVMFIHREDKRNAESDRPNIAEILIEKHRNGPTGSTELYFDEKRASFQPLDTAGYGDLAGEF